MINAIVSQIGLESFTICVFAWGFALGMLVIILGGLKDMPKRGKRS